MKRLLILTILILPDLALSQNNVFTPHYNSDRFEAFSRFRLEAETYTDFKNFGVRGRVGGYYDTGGKVAGYMAIGVRLARGSFFEFNLFPFWLNYSFHERNYNTPITLECVLWDYKHQQDDLGFRIAIDLDFYEDTFVPSLNVAFQPWKERYK